MKNKIHNWLYPKIKDHKYLSWWYFKIVWGYSLLPFYMDIPFTKYTLAIWNCGEGFKDLRITIREGAEWRVTIKQGDHQDEKRISKYFKPFR